MSKTDHKKQPSMASDSDEQDLVKKAQLGDREAFSEIVRRNEEMVYSFAFKICRDKNYAEETLQDTFVNVFHKLQQFNGQSKLSTWLYSIVTNNCLMKRRKSKLDEASIHFDKSIKPPRPHQGEDDDTQDHLTAWKTTPLDEIMTKELRQYLDKAIQKLPLDYRLVFILRDLENRTAEETATIMKLSIPAVKSRLRRARVFLREELQEYMTT